MILEEGTKDQLLDSIAAALLPPFDTHWEMKQSGGGVLEFIVSRYENEYIMLDDGETKVRKSHWILLVAKGMLRRMPCHCTVSHTIYFQGYDDVEATERTVPRSRVAASGSPQEQQARAGDAAAGAGAGAPAPLEGWA
jgi:hypothetical protein